MTAHLGAVTVRQTELDRFDHKVWMVDVIRNPSASSSGSSSSRGTRQLSKFIERSSSAARQVRPRVFVTFRGVFALSSVSALGGFLHPGHTIHGGSVPIIRGVSGIQGTPFTVGQ